MVMTRAGFAMCRCRPRNQASFHGPDEWTFIADRASQRSRGTRNERRGAGREGGNKGAKSLGMCVVLCAVDRDNETVRQRLRCEAQAWMVRLVGSRKAIEQGGCHRVLLVAGRR